MIGLKDPKNYEKIDSILQRREDRSEEKTEEANPLEELPPPETFFEYAKDLNNPDNFTMVAKLACRYKYRLTFEEFMPIFEFIIQHSVEENPTLLQILKHLLSDLLTHRLSYEIFENGSILETVVEQFPVNYIIYCLYNYLLADIPMFHENNLECLQILTNQNLIPRFIQIIQTQQDQSLLMNFFHFVGTYFSTIRQLNNNRYPHIFEFDYLKDAFQLMVNIAMNFDDTTDTELLFYAFSNIAPMCGYGPFAVYFFNHPKLGSLLETISPDKLAPLLFKVIYEVLEPDPRIQYPIPSSPDENGHITYFIHHYDEYTTKNVKFEESPLIPYFITLLGSEDHNIVRKCMEVLSLFSRFPSVIEQMFEQNVVEKLFEIVNGNDDFEFKNQAILFLLSFLLTKDEDKLNHLIELGIVDLIQEYFDQQNNSYNMRKFISACFDIVSYGEIHHKQEYRDLIYDNDEIMTVLTRISDDEFSYLDTNPDEPSTLAEDALAILCREENPIDAEE